jgi:hypothetical protein
VVAGSDFEMTDATPIRRASCSAYLSPKALYMISGTLRHRTFQHAAASRPFIGTLGNPHIVCSSMGRLLFYLLYPDCCWLKQRTIPLVVRRLRMIFPSKALELFVRTYFSCAARPCGRGREFHTPNRPVPVQRAVRSYEGRGVIAEYPRLGIRRLLSQHVRYQAR